MLLGGVGEVAIGKYLIGHVLHAIGAHAVHAAAMHGATNAAAVHSGAHSLSASMLTAGHHSLTTMAMDPSVNHLTRMGIAQTMHHGLAGTAAASSASVSGWQAAAEWAGIVEGIRRTCRTEPYELIRDSLWDFVKEVGSDGLHELESEISSSTNGLPSAPVAAERLHDDLSRILESLTGRLASRR